MFGRQKVAAIVAEFMGTYVLTSVVLGVITRTAFPFFAAAAAGLTLAMVVLTFGKVSGAQINPAVTVGLWVMRKVEMTTALVYLGAQFLGAFVAYRVSLILLGSALKNTAGDNIDWRIITAEAVGTFIFTVGIAAAVSRAYEGAKFAATIGVSLMLGILVASLASNGVLNPAVALGVNSWSASYVAGPVLGSIAGFSLYSLLFAPLDAPRVAQSVTEPEITARPESVAKASRAATKKPVKKPARKR